MGRDRPGRQLIRIVLAAALAAPFAVPLSAGEDMTSPNFRVPRSSSGGGAGSNSGSASTNFKLEAGIGEDVARSSTSSANFRLGAGYVHIFAFPAVLTDLAGLDSISLSSVTLQWTAPGSDQNQGPLGVGSTYYLRIASYTVPDTFSLFSQANVAASTFGIVPGMTVSTNIYSLIPNTTYYVNFWTQSTAGDLSFPTRSTFTTLALLPVSLGFADTFPAIQRSTISVAWGGLFPLSVDVGSMSSGGYTLEVSSTNFGQLAPGGVMNSSTTFSAAASTLTVAFPDVDFTTNYYRVSSLNWEGRRHTFYIGKMNFQIAQSSPGIQIGSIDMSVALSTVATSSIVVRNVGELPATFLISGDMATIPSSPWTLGESVGVDGVVVQGLWNSGPPGPPESAFSTFITPIGRLSQAGGHYAGDQNGVAVPPGEERTLWFRVQIPASTSSNSEEVIGVDVQPVRP